MHCWASLGTGCGLAREVLAELRRSRRCVCNRPAAASRDYQKLPFRLRLADIWTPPALQARLCWRIEDGLRTIYPYMDSRPCARQGSARWRSRLHPYIRLRCDASLAHRAIMEIRALSHHRPHGLPRQPPDISGSESAGLTGHHAVSCAIGGGHLLKAKTLPIGSASSVSIPSCENRPGNPRDLVRQGNNSNIPVPPLS